MFEINENQVSETTGTAEAETTEKKTITCPVEACAWENPRSALTCQKCGVRLFANHKSSEGKVTTKKVKKIIEKKAKAKKEEIKKDNKKRKKEKKEKKVAKKIGPTKEKKTPNPSKKEGTAKSPRYSRIQSIADTMKEMKSGDIAELAHQADLLYVSKGGKSGGEKASSLPYANIAIAALEEFDLLSSDRKSFQLK